MPRRPQPSRVGEKLTRKVPVLFTESEHMELVRLSIQQDRPTCNLLHWLAREYIAGRMVPSGMPEQRKAS